MMRDDRFWGHGAGWEGPMMLVFMIIVAIAIIVAIVFIVRYFGHSQSTPSALAGNAPESPKGILERRYAAGEIDREEYLQRLGDL